MIELCENLTLRVPKRQGAPVQQTQPLDTNLLNINKYLYINTYYLIIYEKTFVIN